MSDNSLDFLIYVSSLDPDVLLDMLANNPDIHRKAINVVDRNRRLGESTNHTKEIHTKH